MRFASGRLACRTANQIRHRLRFNHNCIDEACGILHALRSAYYKWVSGKWGPRTMQNERIAKEVEKIHMESVALIRISPGAFSAIINYIPNEHIFFSSSFAYTYTLNIFFQLDLQDLLNHRFADALTPHDELEHVIVLYRQVFPRLDTAHCVTPLPVLAILYHVSLHSVLKMESSKSLNIYKASQKPLFS